MRTAEVPTGEGTQLMTAAGSGLGWPACGSRLDAGRSESGVGWPVRGLRPGTGSGAAQHWAVGADGEPRVGAPRSAGTGLGEISLGDDAWRRGWPDGDRQGAGRSGDGGSDAEGAAAVRGRGSVSPGLGWPVVTDVAADTGVSVRAGRGVAANGHGLGWPRPESERRHGGSAAAVGLVSRETEQPIRPEPFARPESEVTARAEEGGGGYGGTRRTASQVPPDAAASCGIEADAGSEPLSGTEPSGESTGLPAHGSRPSELESAALERGASESWPFSVDRPKPEAGLAERGLPGLAGLEASAAQRSTEASGAQHRTGASASESAGSAHQTPMRYGRNDEAVASDQSSWSLLEGGNWSPASPRHGVPIRMLQRESAALAGERPKFGSGDVRAESNAAIRSMEQRVLGGPQLHGRDGPMIAGTYSGAKGAQDESEDEVVVPVVPDASADTPIARAAEAAMSARASSRPWPHPRGCRIVTIANQKGGVGKTTTAVNLAASLAMHGCRVLVVDLDPQGNASTALDVEHRSGTSSIYNVLVDGLALADVVRPVEGFPLLHCAPATIDLAGAEIELVPLVARESRLARAVSGYDASSLDYIFIDCPPSLGLLTVNALVAAPEVLIPIQCEYYALEGLEQLLRTVELVKSHLNPNLKVTTILLTMFDSRTRLASQVADEVRGHFGDLVLHSVIPRSVRVSEAPSYGQSVMTYDPGSSGALAYLEAAREMAYSNAEATTA